MLTDFQVLSLDKAPSRAIALTLAGQSESVPVVAERGRHRVPTQTQLLKGL